MAYNSNFDVSARIEGEHLNVTGISSGDPGDLKLISRHFIVQQHNTVEARQAEETLLGNWGAVRPMSSEGFEPGDAVVLGTETFYLDRDGAPATFSSTTWSQAIVIE